MSAFIWNRVRDKNGFAIADCPEGPEQTDVS